MGKTPTLHGYVVAIGPANNLNFFTGSGYSVHLNDAKVFRTKQGGMSATRHWQTADYNPNPLPPSWWMERRAIPVSLKREQ